MLVSTAELLMKARETWAAAEPPPPVEIGELIRCAPQPAVPTRRLARSKAEARDIHWLLKCVERARVERNMTQKEFSHLLGMNPGNYRKFVSGAKNRKLSSVCTLERMLAAVGYELTVEKADADA